MLRTTLLLLCAAPAAAASPVLAPSQVRAEPPPSMVLVEGGRTTIGSTTEQIEAIGEENKLNLGPTVVELPQHTVQVDDFFLGVTEVTNEQYLAFIKATGARPPELWAEQVIDEAQRQFLEERKGATGEKFDRTRWWRMNWEGKPWEMPPKLASLPVVYVDFRDAQAYVRWAGLRLMTEQEFQRAGRGKTGNIYPWGDTWDDAKAAGVGLRSNLPKPAGSFPEGAIGGVHDLSGHVWEWTASRFEKYPGWSEDIELEIGKGKNAKTYKTAGMVQWNASQRVVVGGCFQVSPIVCRLTTRRPTERDAATDALGFRVAATILPGVDIAEAVMRDDLPAEKRAGSEFDHTKALAFDRWRTSPGTVEVPEYEVIEAYDYVLYVPTVQLEGATVNALGGMSLESGPVALGALSISIPVLEPALEPGTYLVAYRGAGEAKAPVTDPEKAGRQDSSSAKAPALPEGYDIKTPALIFYDTNGKPVGFLPDPSIESARPSRPEAKRRADTRMVPGTNAAGEPAEVPEPVDRVDLKVNSEMKISNKGYTYTIPLKFPKGALGDGWRNLE